MSNSKLEMSLDDISKDRIDNSREEVKRRKFQRSDHYDKNRRWKRNYHNIRDKRGDRHHTYNRFRKGKFEERRQYRRHNDKESSSLYISDLPKDVSNNDLRVYKFNFRKFLVSVEVLEDAEYTGI